MAKDKNNTYTPGINKNRHKHYWWRYLLVFIAGQLSLIVGLVVGVVGVTTSVELGEVLQMANVDPNTVLTEEYQGETIFSIVTKFSTGTKTFNSINDIAEITPLVDNYLDQGLEMAAKYGVSVDKETLISTNFNELADFFTNTLQEIEIKGLISSFGFDINTPLFDKILTKDDNTSLKIGDLTSLDFMSILNKLTLGDILGPSSFEEGGQFEALAPLQNSTLATIKDDAFNLKLSAILGESDDASGIMKTLGNFTINDLMDANTFNTIKIGDLLDITSEEGILKYFGGLTIGDISSGRFLDDATIGDIMGIDPSDTSLLGKLADCKLNADSISAELNSLQISDVLEIGDDAMPLLLAIKDCYLMNVPADAPEGSQTIVDKMQTLTVGDLFNPQEGDMLYDLRDSTLSTLTDDIVDVPVRSLLPAGDGFIEEIRNYSWEETVDGETVTKYITLGNIGDKMFEVLEECTLDSIMDIPSGSLVDLFRHVKLNPESIEARINTLKIGDILPSNGNKIMEAIGQCYIKAVPDDDPTGITIEERLNQLKLCEVVSTSGNSILAVLADGYLFGVPSSDPDGKLMTELIDTLTLKDVLPISAESPAILKAIQDCYLFNVPSGVTGETVEEKISKLTLGEMIDINSDSPAILKKLANCTLSGENSIENAMATLQLKDAIELGDNPSPILSALADCYLTTVPTSDPDGKTVAEQMGQLKISDCIEIDDSSSSILKFIADCKFDEIDDKMNEMTFEDMFADEIYTDATHSEVKSTWKYMLTDEYGNCTPSAYKITTDMGKLIENMQRNMQTHTIRELVADGFLSIDESKLNAKIFGTNVVIGDCTLSELVNSIPTM